MRNEHWRSLLIGLAVCATTVIASLLAIEVATESFLPEPYQWDRRLMFFSEGSVFQNKSWGGFVYQPNIHFTSRTIYITDPKKPTLVDEYQYNVTTNSAGLVQLKDVSRAKPSIIFLGDSYTEGQGATPWFYELERRWPAASAYQIVNGGIIGSGFEAWERLRNDLSSTIDIEKVVILFISSDWTRPVWQISERDLQCIRSSTRCDGSNDFLGLPRNQFDAETEIHRIADERVNYVAAEKRKQSWLKSTAIYRRLLRPAYYLWWPSRKADDEAQFEKSENAIRKMAEAVGLQNILLIQLPQKDELSSKLDHLSQRGRDFINQVGLTFVDGFKTCNLTAADFHKNDGHPNTEGYAKIVDCVERSVKETFSP